MSDPLVNPWRRMWPYDAATFGAMRLAFRSYAYPSGLPASLPDSVTPAFSDLSTLVSCGHTNVLAVTIAGNSHGNVQYTNQQPGHAGVTVKHVVAGINTVRSVVVTGLVVVVNVATDSDGAVANTETANNIAAAVNANSSAYALVAALGNISTGSNGTGLVLASLGGVGMMTGSTLTSLPGMSSMRLLTFTSPGGRSGGTPLYALHLIPAATRINVCVLWLSGHSDIWPWWMEYAPSTGESVISRALAMGMDVIVADMTGMGLQPRPTQIVVGGTLGNYAAHAYQALDGDGGPVHERYQCDFLIQATNQIVYDHPGIRLILAGHSGGGLLGAMLATFDERFIHWSELQGQIPSYWRPTNADFIGTSDIEQWKNDPIYRYCGGGYGQMFALAASVPGRKSLFCYGDTDTTYPGVIAERATAWAEGLDECVRSATGARASLYRMVTDPPNNHMPTPAEAAAWEADVRATLGIT